MSYTPGPWSLAERSERDGVCIDVIAGERAIARGVAASPTHYGETEGSANARLIAAAPNLLAALKLMVMTWDTYLADAKRYRGYNDAVAAIAKAEGK